MKHTIASGLFFISLTVLASCYKAKVDTPVIEPVDTSAVVTIAYKEKSKTIYDNIISHYSIPGTNLLRENFPAQPGDPANAYFWPHTSMLSGAMLVQSLGYTDPSFQKILDGMDSYWDDRRLPAGYQSSPVTQGSSDRFYDDNAIAGLDLLRAYEVTGQQQYLDLAKKCLEFDISGESAEEGGGLFWNEQYRLNNIAHPWSIKATNVTSLSANLALRLYLITQTPSYLLVAKRWYEWTKLRMQDPDDKIYWNDVAMKDGVINKTKWAYNTGAMITNASLLFTITQEDAYLAEAKSLAQASYNYFTRTVRDLGRFFPPNDPWFTMILLRGYMDLYKLDKNAEYINVMIKNVDYAWLHARNTEGMFFEDWTGDRTGRYYSLLTQECMVEIYALISKFKEE